MKIAIFHELHQGGARRSADEIAKQLRIKHTTDLYLVADRIKKEDKAFYSSVHLYKFIDKKWKGNNWRVRLYKDTVELLKLYFLHKKIARDIINKKYDIVLIHPSQFTQTPFLLNFLKTPKIYYCQEPLRLAYDTIFENKQFFAPKAFYEQTIRTLRKMIDKHNIKNTSAILCNSLFSKKNIKKAYDREATVCYLGVDSKFFSPERKKRDIDILFISKHDRREDNQLIEKIKDNIGHRYKWITLQNIKQGISDRELKAYYQRAKIVLCLSKNEPFGLIPLEAGASGCVTIALKEGGFKESIKDGITGFLVSDAKSFSEKISYLLKNENKLLEMSMHARSHLVKEWSWKKTSAQIETLMKEMVKK